MPDLDRITIVLETLPGARAQVSVNINTPTPGMRLATPAHALAIDALGWLGKQPAVAGFVYGMIPPDAGLRCHDPDACAFGQSACPTPSACGCPPSQAAHIVLDLETLSTQPDAVVASIGAVALTASGHYLSEFHAAITTGAPQGLRHVCPNTCAWWDKQTEDAKLASIHAANTLLPSQALAAFTAWVQQHADPKKVKVWGNGSSFDNVILSSLYADYPEQVRPWVYWNDRDMRTVLDLHPQAKNVGEFEGVKHNALHDARHEAKQLAAVLQAIAHHDAPSLAACDVLAERQRQISAEGWTAEHDDKHYGDGELSDAAVAYATAPYSCSKSIAPHPWPWTADWWKPSTPRRDLVKAAALILAEIERLDRATAKEQAA